MDFPSQHSEACDETLHISDRRFGTTPNQRIMPVQCPCCANKRAQCWWWKIKAPNCIYNFVITSALHESNMTGNAIWKWWLFGSSFFSTVFFNSWRHEIGGICSPQEGGAWVHFYVIAHPWFHLVFFTCQMLLITRNYPTFVGSCIPMISNGSTGHSSTSLKLLDPLTPNGRVKRAYL